MGLRSISVPVGRRNEEAYHQEHQVLFSAACSFLCLQPANVISRDLSASSATQMVDSVSASLTSWAAAVNAALLAPLALGPGDASVSETQLPFSLKPAQLMCC